MTCIRSRSSSSNAGAGAESGRRLAAATSSGSHGVPPPASYVPLQFEATLKPLKSTSELGDDEIVQADMRELKQRRD